MEKLNKKVAVYVPSTVDKNIQVDTSKTVTAVAAHLANLYGGSTCMETIGNYIADNGELIAEKITIVYSFTSRKQLAKTIKSILQLANTVKTELTQECVSIEVNNKLMFI